MHTHARLVAAVAFASALASARSAVADPPTLVARPSLRDGLRVDACRAGGRCETWAQFPARPYRSFVEARMSPSGRFFYVWSTPDGHPRELDVFATPRREGQVALRRGHWSPGAGGELAWVARDRLWQTWGCGSACSIAQLYDVYGTTLASYATQDVSLSPDGRFAVIAGANEGTVVDLARTATHSFRGPPGFHHGGNVTWTGAEASVWFERDHADAHAPRERRAVRVTMPGVTTETLPRRASLVPRLAIAGRQRPCAR